MLLVVEPIISRVRWWGVIQRELIALGQISNGRQIDALDPHEPPCAAGESPQFSPAAPFTTFKWLPRSSLAMIGILPLRAVLTVTI